jgi:hypothetical protein
MFERKFRISSGWDARAETPEQLGQRMRNTLDAVGEINPLLHDWWIVDLRTRVEKWDVTNVNQYFFPFENVREHMTEIAEYGVRRDDFWQPEPAGGFSIRACNSIEDTSYYASLNAHGGGIVDPRAGLRYVSFETNDNPGVEPPIVSYPVFKAVLMAIVAAWDVKSARATSRDLQKFWHKPNPYPLDMGWMTYVSEPIARKIVPPHDVLVERTDDDGLLMIAAEETFDTSNPKHTAAARSILASLADFNAEEERVRELLWPSQPLRSV